ncbi:hypothetical protein [Pelagicoccus sp. SDUM812002]|uniref:hypothetical protein n=1 Tax=Pelagicoccus sp. SDUM812002 TaxID=3041266 RepID=UPI00280D8A76|nr:hypothetical protein [Pelagicoccus sp. SDUM812002]MDQ8188188.1 hypothetical protein [Pelagicoccus sp. SDUM812002]
MKQKFIALLAAFAAPLVGSLCHAQADSPLFVFDFSGPGVSSKVDAIEAISSWSNGIIGGGALSFDVPKNGSSTTSFSFNLAEGYQVDLTGVSFNASENVSQGSFSFSWTLGGSSPLTDTDGGILGTSSSLFDYNFDTPLTAGESTVFSLTGVAGGKDNKLSLDNVTIFGTVSAVPEPAVLAAVIPALFASMYFARKRKKAAAV